MPASTGTAGRAGSARAVHATASASTSRSTWNFTGTASWTLSDVDVDDRRSRAAALVVFSVWIGVHRNCACAGDADRCIVSAETPATLFPPVVPHSSAVIHNVFHKLCAQCLRVTGDAFWLPQRHLPTALCSADTVFSRSGLAA